MTLAPIRGAPPGAPVPDFPVEEAKPVPARPAAVPAAHPQRASTPRQQGSPIEIGGDGCVLIFKVDPELPAIRRASLTIRVIGRNSTELGFLQMSAARAREFLADLRRGDSPMVVTGDEDGVVRIRYELTGTGSVFLLDDPTREPLHCVVERDYLAHIISELLADLGA